MATAALVDASPASALPRVVVLGWGNITRSDDALGPLLLERIRREHFEHVTVIEDFQLQPEHALDLSGHHLALFVDAGFETPAPFAFFQTAPKASTAFSSHTLAPEAVLDIHERVLGEPSTPAFVLSVAGEDFSVGDRLSAAAAERLELASAFLLQRLRLPTLESWRAAEGKLREQRESPS
jgi:hydrogenase maturation protease